METHFPDVARAAADQDSTQTLYFDKFARSYLLSALRSSIIENASEATKQAATRSDAILPYRLLRSLMDKPEIGDLIVSDVLPDLCTCLKTQVESLGGVLMDRTTIVKPSVTRPSSVKEGGGGSKKGGKKSHKLEILQSANLFFSSLTPEQLWQWMELLLSGVITAGVGTLRERVNSSDQHEPTQSAREYQEGEKVGEEEEEGVGREEGEGEGVVSSERVGEGTLPSSPVYCNSAVSLEVRVNGLREGRGGGGGGVQLSCSSACRLIHFLLQVLPLVCRLQEVYYDYMQ